MGRPDFERIRRNATVVFGGAGETATLRSYVSAGDAAAHFGINAPPFYVETTITALFASDIFGAPRPQERDRAGGQAQEARLMVTTDRPVSSRDEIIWRGTAYRVQGDPVPQHLGGQVQYRNPLALAGPTG